CSFDGRVKTRTRSNAFAFGDFISFDWRQKKRSKEKRLVSKANTGSRCRGDFSRGHPALVEKRRTSMCGALRVCGIQPGVGIFSVKSERQRQRQQGQPVCASCACLQVPSGIEEIRGRRS